MDEFPETWTVAQAWAWACTRDSKAVASASADPSSIALSKQLILHLRGELSQRRVGRRPGEPSTQWVPLLRGDHGHTRQFPLFLKLLETGKIPFQAKDVRTGQIVIVDPWQMSGLRFEIRQDDPNHQYGFCGPDGSWRFVELVLPVCSVLERFPPGGGFEAGPTKIPKATIERILVWGANRNCRRPLDRHRRSLLFLWLHQTYQEGRHASIAASSTKKA
jgi:hypothetical protein